MDVYDTNVWIFGLRDLDSRAGDLVQQAIHGDRLVLVSPYVCKEVIRNIGDGLSYPESEEVTNSFATFVKESDTIIGPDQEQVSEMDIDAEREKLRVRMISDAVGCQSKDAPVVEDAYNIAAEIDSKPTIFTNDGGSNESEDDLVDVDFAQYYGAKEGGILPNPLGMIRTEYVPEPPSVS